jgi:hypothetical protein
MRTNRIEAFSDGVIAVIITIMVLELKVPRDTTLTSLLSIAPQFLAYLLSFLVVAIMWVNHHHLLHAARRRALRRRSVSLWKRLRDSAFGDFLAPPRRPRDGGLPSSDAAQERILGRTLRRLRPARLCGRPYFFLHLRFRRALLLSAGTQAGRAGVAQLVAIDVWEKVSVLSRQLSAVRKDRFS